MTFFYRSTRGQAPRLDFRGVTLQGLASDGGLYLPEAWPQFSRTDYQSLRGLSYVETAVRVILPFVDPVLSEGQLRKLVQRAYASFSSPDVVPLKPFGYNRWIMELFHGPTLAFKDVALQLIGPLFELFLEMSGEKMTVLAATSGDTGSAAIAALANRKNIQTVILYPHEKPSPIQRKQMTCAEAENVHVLAVRGSFDDCQAIVKALFRDEEARRRYHLAAINSINWVRILAQMVYYVFSSLRLGGPEEEVSFAVPTGNFGDIFAGYAARRCGLPIRRLVVASNSNNILPRFFETGEMRVGAVVETYSPSMDIQISSNFERLLFDMCQEKAEDVVSCMKELAEKGSFKVAPSMLEEVRGVFLAASSNNEETIETIRSVYERTGEVLDPHTAVGVAAMEKLSEKLPGVVVALATAHPAKFPETIKKATGFEVFLPDRAQGIFNKEEKMTIINNDIQEVREFLSTRIG